MKNDLKNNKIAVAYERIKPNDKARQRAWEKVTAAQNRKRSIIPTFAATAAVLAGILLIYSLIPAQPGNYFIAGAYVPGHRMDGTTERIELDIWDKRQTEGTIEQIEVDLSAGISGIRNVFFDGTNLYFNIAFDITGENIASAELSIVHRDGYGSFARQRIDNDNVLISMRDELENRLNIVFGTEFESLGTRITLEDMDQENYSYAVAVAPRFGLHYETNPYYAHNIPPGILRVQIDVVFKDGEMQSKLMTFNYGNRGDVPFFVRDLYD